MTPTTVSDGDTPPTDEARHKIRAFRGDESNWRQARLCLQRSGAPGYPGAPVSLRGDGRLRKGKTELPTVDRSNENTAYHLFIEGAFTESDAGNEPSVPGEILISLKPSVGICRRHHLRCFAGTRALHVSSLRSMNS